MGRSQWLRHIVSHPLSLSMPSVSPKKQHCDSFINCHADTCSKKADRKNRTFPVLSGIPFKIPLKKSENILLLLPHDKIKKQ